MMPDSYDNFDQRVREGLQQAVTRQEGVERLVSSVIDAYYNGMPDELAPRRRPMGGLEPSDNFRDNPIRYIIDQGRRVTIGNGADIVSISSDNEKALKAWEQYNSIKPLAPQLIDLLTTGALTGHNYVEITDIDETGLPHLTIHDGATTQAITAPGSVSPVYGYVIMLGSQPFRARRLIIRGYDMTGEFGKPEYIGAVDGDWLKVDQILPDDGMASKDKRLAEDKWVTTNVITWPHDWCPMADAKNLPNPGRFVGLPDVDGEDYDLARMANRIRSNTVRVYRAHSNPVRFGFGLPTIKSVFNRFVQGITGRFKGPNSQQGGEMEVPATDLLPGDYVVLKDEKGFIKHDAVDPRVADGLMLADHAEEKLLRNTATRNIRRDKNTGSVQSGIALQLLMQDEQGKVADKIGLYSPLIRWMAMRVIQLMGVEITAAEIFLSWPSPTIMTEKEQIENAQALVNLGASQTTALQKVGLNYQEELDRKKREEEAEVEAGLDALDRLEAGGLE